jgi:hypothetical protein
MVEPRDDYVSINHHNETITGSLETRFNPGASLCKPAGCSQYHSVTPIGSSCKGVPILNLDLKAVYQETEGASFEEI